MIVTAKFWALRLSFLTVRHYGGVFIGVATANFSCRLGVREGVLVSFCAYGVATEKAFATSVIYGITELAAAMLALLIGSAVPVFFRFFPTQSSSEHQ